MAQKEIESFRLDYRSNFAIISCFNIFNLRNFAEWCERLSQGLRLDLRTQVANEYVIVLWNK